MAGPSPMLEYAYFEGDIVPFADAKISVGTHAVQYGTGAFAGIRGYLDPDGETINIFRLPEHAPGSQLGQAPARPTPLHPGESLAETIVALVEKNAPAGDVYIRPFVYKSSVQLTPRLNGLDDELAIYMLKLGDYLDTVSGVKASVSSWHRVPDNAVPSRGKLSGSYINSALAKDEAEEKEPMRPSCSTSTGMSPKGVAVTSFWCATVRSSPPRSPATSWRGSPVAR